MTYDEIVGVSTVFGSDLAGGYHLARQPSAENRPCNARGIWRSHDLGTRAGCEELFSLLRRAKGNKNENHFKK